MQKPWFYLTARQIGTIQDAIVARAKADGAPDREIAAAAGVSDTMVPHWRMTKPDGLRHMRIVDLLGLMREYGAVKVLGPLAARDGCEIVQREPDGAGRDPVGAGVVAMTEAARVLSEVHAASADGVWAAEERERVLSSIDTLTDRLNELRAAVGGAR